MLIITIIYKLNLSIMRFKTNLSVWLTLFATAMLLWPSLILHAQGGDTRTFPLNEDFETGIFPPTGWNVFDIDALGTIWEPNPTINHTPAGTTSGYHGYAPGAQDGWMVTPAMSFPATGPIVLAFWNWTVDITFYAKNSVLISTGSGNPADGDFVEIWTDTSVASAWQQVVLNLAAYAGQTVYVAFRYEGDYAHGWAFDDVFIGSEFNTSPVLLVSPMEINGTAPANSSVTRNLTITNGGLDNLVYSLSMDYEGGVDGWMTVAPMDGDITGGANQVHSVVLSPEGLELGEYTASITINSNDPETPELIVPVNFTVIEPATVEVNIMAQEYLFPMDISESGEYVAVSGFGGGGSFLWSKSSGITVIGGEEATVQAVSEEGVVGGTVRNPDYQISGMGVFMAGYWHPQTQEWTFLGLNPAAGEPIYNDYTSCWGMTADGSTIVGMQYLEGYDYLAFKWTQAGGYEMIGDVNPAGNRPNGISNDGSVVFGWANLPAASRSPVIWYNNEFIQIAPEQWGEAFGASSTGEYVVGTAGEEGFIWTIQGGAEFFPNSLNAGGLSPIAVTDDGTVLGYTAEGWPPFPDTRRAFVRLPSGEMMTFNDYALGRGMADASDWTFYSINGVTPDGNKFIGAGITPEAQNVSFMIDFGAEIPTIVVTPMSLTELLFAGETSTQDLVIQNTGNGPLDYETFINYTQASKNGSSIKVPVGKNHRKGGIELKSISTKGTEAPQNKSRNSFILNYDGENADAIGLTAGGAFNTAARFPAEMVLPFEGASLESVDVYINDLPSTATLKIWGPGTTTAPGALLHEQPFTPAAYSWNTVSLSAALTLDGNDIWVGTNYTHDGGLYIAGIDGGPVDPNGDFLSEDGIVWERLSTYGFNSNWNIRAMLQLGDGNWLSLNPDAGTVAAESSETIVATFDPTMLTGGNFTANIIITSNDPETPMMVVPVTLDYLTGIAENPMSAIEVYPVPAISQLNINLVEGVIAIRLINYFGQTVLESKINGERTTTLNLDGLSAGVYTLQFSDAKGKTSNRKIIISK